MNRTLVAAHSSDWLFHSTLFTNQHVRGFISESGVIFNFVQRVSKNQELLNSAELVKASRKYRSVIHSWFIKVNLLQDGSRLSEAEQEELEQLAKVLHQMEIAWHLCEILFIDIRSAGTLLVQLLGWIKWHFTSYVELAEQVSVSELPQMHEYYWDIVMFFALRGDMENAALFLELHSEAKTDSAFIMVRDLLKKFPLISNAQIFHEYYLRWDLWHQSVVQTVNENKLPASNKKSYIQLNLLLRLLSGDLDAFQQVTYLFHSWYQMMVSYALFTDPCFKSVENLVAKFIGIFESQTGQRSANESSFDELIRAALDYELMDVIKHGSMCFGDNWWFITHFIDLIYNSNEFNTYKLADISQIRESFVVDYANSLFSKPKHFWQLSIEYLLHSKSSRDHIRSCLERTSHQDERQLQKLLSLCRRFNFDDLEVSLYRIEARRWLSKTNVKGNKHKFGSALFWAVRAQDKLLINYVVDQYLRHYLKTASDTALRTNKMVSDGDLLDTDVIKCIDRRMVLSERLIFLCKYHEFHLLRNEEHHPEAAKILLDMLASNAIPDFFVYQVILNLMPLLESPDVVLEPDEISTILASLEQILARLDGDHVQQPNSEQEEMHHILNYQKKVVKNFESMLRLAISRNLTRNFVLVRPV